MVLESIRDLALRMQVLDQVHDSVIATNLDGFIASWSRGAERLHGYAADEAIGRHISMLTGNDARDALTRECQAELLATGFKERTVDAVAKNGRRHAMHVRLSLIRDSGGEAVGVLYIAIDTTELEQARADLHRREAQLCTMLDAIPLCVAHLDTDLKFQFVNNAYVHLTQRSPAELIGRPLKECFPVDFPALEPKARQALAGVASAVEDEFTLSDGQRRVMLVQRVPDKTSDGTVHGYFVVCTDVTESKRAEQARLEEERRFREALIAEVHHRVKNSLQGVVGLLRSQSEQRPELAAALEPAISQVMAISVGFGLMSTRGLRGIVLCDVVREVGRNLSQITAANVETTLSESVTRDPIELDQAHAVNLSLVINELTFNAIKHQTGSASPVQVRLDRTKESVTIQIWSATGRLPDRFDFESGAGLGTGLSLVRLLLPRRGCTLSYSSRDGGVVATVALELGALGPPN